MATITPHAAHQPFIGPLRLAVKTLRLLGLILVSIVLIPITPLLGQRRAPALVRWWYGCMLRVFNVRVHVHGHVPDTPALVVTNHSTWLDILVLGHTFDSVFISKAEVEKWPIVGIYARVVGTLFLQRGAHKTHSIRQQVQATFDRNRSVILFPEGTTTTTPQPRHFHARLFAAAIDGEHAVLPVCVRYYDEQTPQHSHNPLVPWVDAPLLPNIVRVFRLPGLHVDLHVQSCIHSSGHNRRSLAHASHEAITQALPPQDR